MVTHTFIADHHKVIIQTHSHTATRCLPKHTHTPKHLTWKRPKVTQGNAGVGPINWTFCSGPVSPNCPNPPDMINVYTGEEKIFLTPLKSTKGKACVCLSWHYFKLPY